MDGDTPGRQRLDESPLVVALTDQNGGRWGLVALSKLADQPPCNRFGFIVERLLKNDLDGDTAGLRRRLQNPHIGPGQGGKWSRNLIGYVQNIRAIAPAGGERKCRDGSPAKSSVKIAEVGTTGPAPAIDGLVRVSHRHHRVAREQQGEQRALSDAGVLILIEEHHAVSRTNVLADLRVSGHQFQRERNLVRELDDTAEGFGARIITHKFHHRNQ